MAAGWAYVHASAGNGTVFAEEKSVERLIKGSIARNRWLGTYLHGAGQLDVCAGRDPVQLALNGDLGGDCKKRKEARSTCSYIRKIDCFGSGAIALI